MSVMTTASEDDLLRVWEEYREGAPTSGRKLVSLPATIRLTQGSWVEVAVL